MSAFACCFWWFLFGALLGWLLNWLLSKWTRKDGSDSTGSGNYNSTSHTSNQASHAYASNANTVTAGATGASVALAAAAGFKIKGNNDLEVIEGIGPKIADLFRNNGTHTFAQLSSMSLAEMHKVLENGGSRFKLANPGSWAQQARLCHENRWSELKALQDTLDGGVHNADSHNV
jgi:predicted flap endonuclease-1-like 5' DNA nuclease